MIRFTSWRNRIRRVISGRRRSRYRYLRRSISFASIRSSIRNGGVSASQQLHVARRDLDLAGPELRVDRAVRPRANRTRHAHDVLGAEGLRRLVRLGGFSGWNTSCTTPSRSRRSTNVTPPWSRRRATQPHSVTSGPASPPRRSPHACAIAWTSACSCSRFTPPVTRRPRRATSQRFNGRHRLLHRRPRAAAA